jgi:meso-butanediol dehydrogenase/(S,S)-butanediol dehydrogenase/diacetyl reductase
VSEGQKDGRYAGKVAVVTGGASGIGEAVVRRLVAEGASVVVGDLNAERLALLEDELGDRVATAQTDVREESAVEALVRTATTRFGRLDTGFNVAGLGAGAPLEDLEEEQWSLVVDVCLKGVFFSMKHEARAMLAQGHGGAIVNVASLNSTVPMIGGAPYCSAKAGAAMLSSCGALEWGDRGIRVNAVSPGLVATPLTAMVSDLPAVRQAYLDRIPMNEVGAPEQIAAACLYLGSDDASYVSGINMFVDGAWATSGYPDLRAAFAELAAPAA